MDTNNHLIHEETEAQGEVKETSCGLSKMERERRMGGSIYNDASRDINDDSF